MDIGIIVDKNYIRVLDENMSNNLEGYITNEEALLALKNKEYNISPEQWWFYYIFFLKGFCIAFY